MAGSAPSSPANDRFPWTILLVVFLLQSVLGGVFCLNQHRKGIVQAREDLVANSQVLETILQTHLQNAQYQEIEPLLTDWVQLYLGRVDHLGLVADNGFVFFRYDQEEPTAHFAERTSVITYSYEGRATLTIRWDLAKDYAHTWEILLLLVVIQLSTTLALVFFLRLAMLRKRDARMLAARAQELDLTNQDLHGEMKQRAVIEANLAREKEQLQVTLRSLGEGVVRIDGRGTILLANTAAEEMMGCREKQYCGEPVDEIMNLMEEESKTRIKLMSSGFLPESGGPPRELILNSRDGGKRAVSLGCFAIAGESDEAAGWVVVLRDITETRHLEQEQRKNSMLEALGVLAGGIAHDFNNILMAISGNLNLAQELSRDDAGLVEILSSADKATDRAADLTRQLLTFAKGGSPILKATAIDAVVREAANFVTHGANLHLEFDFEEGLLPVMVDKHQMGQVIQNLVINARQAMLTGGQLSISCTNVPGAPQGQDDPMVRIEITDQGVGISPSDLKNIFDPYFTTRKEGSGLGLAVVHSIIARHEGRIEARSRLGEGTTFSIHLPATREVGAAIASDEKTLVKGTGRILVMDDDSAVRNITSRLVRQLGFEVFEAEDGAQALEIYRDHLERGQPIDLAIMDLTVPRGMGGQEAVRKLLELDPGCRALVASGYSNDPVMANYREFGFKGSLVKPFNLLKLSQTLGRVLAQQ